jgi:surface protein
MFRGASSLTEIDLSSFNTSNVVDMGWMFFGASGLETLDVTGFDTRNVIDMGLMFREMSSLTALDVTGFETSSVTDMREMFRGTQLTQLDLSSFDTSNVTNMNQMFTALHTLSVLVLGESFSFIGAPNLVPIRQTEAYTGLWQGIGGAFTSAQLMAQFDGAMMAGIFVWQEWITPSPEKCAIVERGRFEQLLQVQNGDCVTMEH